MWFNPHSNSTMYARSPMMFCSQHHLMQELHNPLEITIQLTPFTTEQKLKIKPVFTSYMLYYWLYSKPCHATSYTRTRSQVPCWTHLRVQLCRMRVQLCRMRKGVEFRATPNFQYSKGWEGRARSPGIRLGRGQAFHLLKSASQTNTSWLEFILHPFGVETSHGWPRTHLTHHGPGSGEATTLLSIIYLMTHHEDYTQMALFPETPKFESSDPPKCPGFGLLGLWTVIAPRLDLRSGRGLNQSCSPRRDLFNDVSHSSIGQYGRVDSWLLVVESQTASLTPGASFAHNLGCRCPNRQCEGILDIYTSRPFQWHIKHLKESCFDLPNRLLSFWESRRTPNSHFWEFESHPHTWPNVGVRHTPSLH
jgi:hypothetical protein